jgi:hypothetical protein
MEVDVFVAACLHWLVDGQHSLCVLMEAAGGVAVAVMNSGLGNMDLLKKDPNGFGTSASDEKYTSKATNIETRAASVQRGAVDDAPRDSIQSNSTGTHSTSISSLTVSSAGRPHIMTPPYGDTFPKQFSPKHAVAEKEGGIAPPQTTQEKKAAEQSMTKTLSFRTDSTGSLGSLVSSLDLSSDMGSHSTTPDSSHSTPVRKNANSVSNSSLLISALKQNNKMKKKSVSFSLPSDDDIARRAQRKNSALLYDAFEQFDDNIADYQIASPKGSVDSRNKRGGRQPASRVRAVTEDGQSSAGAALLNSDSGKAGFREAGSPERALPRAVGHGSPVIKRKTSLTGKGMQSTPLLPPAPPSLFPPLHAPIDVLPAVIEEDPSQLSSKSVSEGKFFPPSDLDDNMTETEANNRTNGKAGGNASQTLMQRVHAASTPAQMCEVFGIATESVFNGGNCALCCMCIFSYPLKLGREIW